MVTLKTNKGDIVISRTAEKAPESDKNFLNYACAGHFNGTIFHRVINDFLIQAGAFEPGMKQKEVNASIVSFNSNFHE